MIVADTNVWIAYFTGDSSSDVKWLDAALEANAYAIAPMVAAELLSDPALTEQQDRTIRLGQTLPLLPGYWFRAGMLRASLFRRGLRPKLIDSLIAQFCIDYDASLLTRDAGFKRFVEAGLKLHK